MGSVSDAARVKAIESRLLEASTNWQLGRGGTEIFAVIVANTPPVAIAELTADCGYVDRDFILHAPDDIGFLLQLVRRAADKVRSLRSEEERQAEHAHSSGDFAAECAMKCNEQAFRRFLLEAKGATDVADELRVASEVRRILKIESRGEINRDAGARNRWLDLRAEYAAWKVAA